MPEKTKVRDLETLIEYLIQKQKNSLDPSEQKRTAESLSIYAKQYKELTGEYYNATKPR